MDIKDGDRTYLFNYYRNTVVALNEELTKLLSGLEDIGKLQDIHPSLYEELVKQEFLVPDDLDESKQCREEIDKVRFNKEQVNLTINPTLDCNLRCWYCYEEHEKGSIMSEETVQSVVRLIDRLTDEPELRALHISFFGGEPLMGFRRCVQPILTRAKAICEGKGKFLGIGFTTNAILLPPDKTDWLVSQGLPLFLQVPFDGGRDLHEKTKFDSKGHGHYDDTIRNVRYALAKDIYVTLRCNYTAQNVESFKELLTDLKEEGKRENVGVDFQKVWQEAYTEELPRKVAELCRMAEEYGLKKKRAQGRDVRSSLCYADIPNNMVINYNGDVFQCTARSFDAANRVGTLQKDGILTYNERAQERYARFFLEDCTDCLKLPICEACSQRRMESPHRKCPMLMTRERAQLELREYARDILEIPAKSH